MSRPAAKPRSSKGRLRHRAQQAGAALPEVTGATRTGSGTCGKSRKDAGGLDKWRQSHQALLKRANDGEISTLF
jgi:hypothetical protein